MFITAAAADIYIRSELLNVKAELDVLLTKTKSLRRAMAVNIETNIPADIKHVREFHSDVFG